MANILYCMNTSWGWIKQRPHFIAEGLSKDNNVSVLSKQVFFAHKDKSDTVNLNYMYRLPGERYRFIALCNQLFYVLQFWFYVRHYDVIWLSNPVDFRFARFFTSNKKIIYDCMDDQIELVDGNTRKKLIAKWEARLYKRSDLVLASASFLKNVLVNRYGYKDIEVVNNALKDDFGNNTTTSRNEIELIPKDEISITYIGTIASWMDWSLVEKVIRDIPGTVFHFFGPIDQKPENLSEKIIFHGSLQHDMVPYAMKESKILIMPFVVNDLIKSVNPVKLYEYIFSGRPCIAPLYGESEKFGDYVYLYKDHVHCADIITSIINNGFIGKRTPKECNEFIANNTWHNRVIQIENRINKLD